MFINLFSISLFLYCTGQSSSQQTTIYFKFNTWRKKYQLEFKIIIEKGPHQNNLGFHFDRELERERERNDKSVVNKNWRSVVSIKSGN